jgi:hypothetical protein
MIITTTTFGVELIFVYGDGDIDNGVMLEKKEMVVGSIGDMVEDGLVAVGAFRQMADTSSIDFTI